MLHAVICGHYSLECLLRQWDAQLQLLLPWEPSLYHRAKFSISVPAGGSEKNPDDKIYRSSKQEQRTLEDVCFNVMALEVSTALHPVSMALLLAYS